MTAWLHADTAQALRVQGRVLVALMLRETRTRFGKQQLGYLWALLEPLAHVFVLVTLFSAIGRSSPIGGDIALFFVTGIVPFLLFRHVSTQVGNAVAGNRALLTYPLVTPLDVALARLALEFATMTLVFALILAGLGVLGRAGLPADPLQLLAAWAGLAALGTGLGLVNNAIGLYSPSYEKLYNALVGRTLYFASGIFYVAGNLPPAVRAWLLWNPLMHLVEWSREAFYPGFDSQYIDRGYAIGWSLSLLFLGLLVERGTRRKVGER